MQTERRAGTRVTHGDVVVDRPVLEEDRYVEVRGGGLSGVTALVGLRGRGQITPADR